MVYDAEKQRCLALVSAQSAKLGWSLSPQTISQYTQFLAVRLQEQPGMADTLARTILANYHADHVQVDALRDAYHPLSNHTWEWVRSKVTLILRSKIAERYMHDDGVGGLEDLSQTALQDIVNGLPTFRYHSRLLTWIYTLVSNHLARHYRTQNAHKRQALQSAQSLDAQPVLAETMSDALSSQPDQLTLDRMLRELVNQVLSVQPDMRLQQVFNLSVFDQQTLRAIGEKLELSPARVCMLMKQATAILKNDPAIREWLETGDNLHISV